MEPLRAGEHSDSDISDDWNVIETKDVIPVSESESIEVLGEEDLDSVADDEAEAHEEADRVGEPQVVEKGDGTGDEKAGPTVAAAETSEPGSADDETARRHSQAWVAYPEEGQMVRALRTPRNLLHLCDMATNLFTLMAFFVIVSSFLASNISILKLFDFEGTPFMFGPKTPDSDLGGSDFAACDRRYRSSINKIDHFRLAVKALEENLISVPAFVEFIADIDRPSSSRSMGDGRETDDANTVDFGRKSTRRIYGNSQKQSDKTSQYRQRNDLDRQRYRDESVADNHRMLLNRLLPLFDAPDQHNLGASLNNIALRMHNNNDRLKQIRKLVTKFDDFSNNIKAKLNASDHKLKSLSEKIDTDIVRFFHKLSSKYTDMVDRYEENLKKVVCKGRKIKEELKAFCSNDENNNKADKRTDKRFNKDDEKYRRRDQEEGSKNKGELNRFRSSHLSSGYKMDGDTAGKVKHSYSDVEKDEESKRRRTKESRDVDDEEDDDDEDYKKNKYNDHSSKKARSKFDHESDEGDRKKWNGHESREKRSDYKNKSKESAKKRENEKFERKNKTDVPDVDRKNYFTDRRNKFENVNKDSAESKENKERHNFRLKKNLVEMKYETDDNNDFGWDRKFLISNAKKENEIVFENESKNNKESIEEVNNKVEKEDDTYHTDVENERESSNEGNGVHRENLKKLSAEELSLIKKDVLSSLQSYVEDMFAELKDKPVDRTQTENLLNATYTPGDWFLSIGRERSEKRKEKTKSDWLFNRAENRHTLRHGGDDDAETQWFFRRAWERQQCRNAPHYPWCRNRANFKYRSDSTYKTFKYMHKNQ